MRDLLLIIYVLAIGALGLLFMFLGEAGFETGFVSHVPFLGEIYSTWIVKIRDQFHWDPYLLGFGLIVFVTGAAFVALEWEEKLITLFHKSKN